MKCMHSLLSCDDSTTKYKRKGKRIPTVNQIIPLPKPLIKYLKFQVQKKEKKSWKTMFVQHAKI